MTNDRVIAATRMGFRDQFRHPLLIALVLILPFFFISRAIAATHAIPKEITLPGGTEYLTNMRDIHGASMAAITVAFVAGLCGAFIMRSSRSIDRRLVVAGFHPAEAIGPRLLVLAAATGLVVAVSTAVTSLSFRPESWLWFVVGNLLVGATYACIGAIAGAVLGDLGATYMVLFVAMLGIGVLQNPMFGSGEPGGAALLFPDWAAGRIIIDACFGRGFQAWPELGLALGWIFALGTTVTIVVRRSLGVRIP